MNSLDKMEDYDRLKQERDELAAQVEVMRPYFVSYREGEGKNGAGNYYCTSCGAEQGDSHNGSCKFSITPSAALREIQARTLENAAAVLEEEDDIFRMEGVDSYHVHGRRLRDMAAAIRKGE